MNRSLGVRPISLIGFSLGARMIFYAMLELAKHKAFGIVQDVFLMGATVTASKDTWHEVRSVISGRFVNAYARNDWVLNYLFRAASGGVNTVAGLRPVDDIPGLENIDVTDKIAGHMSYRIYMPVILRQLGFPVTADYFDEPEVSRDVLSHQTLTDSGYFRIWKTCGKGRIRRRQRCKPRCKLLLPRSGSASSDGKRPHQRRCRKLLRLHLLSRRRRSCRPS